MLPGMFGSSPLPPPPLIKPGEMYSNMSTGASGPGVEAVQRNLIANGFLSAQIASAGIVGHSGLTNSLFPNGIPFGLGGLERLGEFGEATQAGVMAFQRKQGLPPDGVMKEAEWKFMFNLALRGPWPPGSNTPSTMNVPTPGPTPSTSGPVTIAQQYRSGTMTGQQKLLLGLAAVAVFAFIFRRK